MTNTPCIFQTCKIFNNNDYTTPLDCPEYNIKIEGIRYDILNYLYVLLQYNKYKEVLQIKSSFAELISAMYGKADLSYNNIYEESLGKIISSIFSNMTSNNNDNEVIEFGISKEIKDLIDKYNNETDKNTKVEIIKNIIKLFERYINSEINNSQLKQQLNFFIKSMYGLITNDEKNKILQMGITITVINIIITQPNVTFPEDELIQNIKVQVENYDIAKIKPNYLKGEFDRERFEMFKSQDEIKVYIASIDSYFYIYKVLNIKDYIAFLLLDLYDYFDSITEKNPNNQNLLNFKNSLMDLFKSMFNIDIKYIEEKIVQEMNDENNK